MVTLPNHEGTAALTYQKEARDSLMPTKTKNKTAPPVEDDEDLELEDLDTDVEEDEAPAKSKAQEVEFGASDLAAYLSEKTGKNISARDLRALIRKMAREETPRVDREITAGNRTRYNWPGGLKHPEVKAIIKAVTGGEMEADKQAKLAELKAKKAAKQAEGGATKGKKGKKGKAAPAPVDEDDDVEEIELDDDDE
jgi:hypothetical protein